LGYKGYHIKEYFEHYFLHESDVTFNFGMQSERVIHEHSAEPWRVTLVNTGLETMTGGRVKKIQKYVGHEAFMLTYGDGVADVNINDLVSYHQKNRKLATVTAIQPSGRFGSLDLSPTNQVLGFEEKPKGDGSWINGGFFVLEPGVFDYIEGDQSVFEEAPLENLAKNGQLTAFKHQKFWQPMDSMRDKNKLNELWDAEKAPWKVW
jgi:glucose-1-phosphate cytidylyltransferase